MAPRTYGHRAFRGGRIVRQWMMPEGKKAPLVGPRKPLTVLHRHVDTVVLTVEIPASGGFRARAVRKSRFKDPGQLFDDDRSLGKGPGCQIRIDIFLFYVYMMKFGEVRLGTTSGLVAVVTSIIEALGS